MTTLLKIQMNTFIKTIATRYKCNYSYLYTCFVDQLQLEMIYQFNLCFKIIRPMSPGISTSLARNKIEYDTPRIWKGY